MSGDTKLTCAFLKPDGAPCSAPPMNGSEFCFFHSPTTAERRKQAQVAGGRASRRTLIPTDMPEYNLTSPDDVRKMLRDVANKVLKGELDHRVANGIGYLANQLLRAIEAGEIAQRLKQIEQALRTK